MEDRGLTIDGEAHLSLTRPSKPAKFLIAVAGPYTIAFESYVDGEARPTIYIDKAKARCLAEYILTLTRNEEPYPDPE